MADDDAKRKFTANPTRAYAPSGGGVGVGFGLAALDGKPWFTWADVPRMLRDPRVRFLERMWRSPFQRARWAVRAEDKRVAAFVDATLRRFWRKSLPGVLGKYFRYGFAPAGAEFRVRRDKVRLDRVAVVEPRDARLLVWRAGRDQGRPAGFTAGGVKVLRPHAMWFAGHCEAGPHHDVPPMAGMFEPWAEKRGRNGAVDSRRLWFRKNAVRGGVLRHPEGSSDYGDAEAPRVRDNQDVARELMEYSEAGSFWTLPNTPNPGNPAKYAWEFEPATSQADVAGLRDYPHDLDQEMAEGIGIPNEVFEAADVGSGWSGRMIPLTAWLGGVDELVGLVIESADAWLRYAVAANFSPAAWYEVEPQSLVDQIKEQAQAGKGGGEGPNPVPALAGQAKPDQGGWQPYQRRDGTPGLKNTVTGGYKAMSDDRADPRDLWNACEGGVQAAVGDAGKVAPRAVRTTPPWPPSARELWGRCRSPVLTPA